MAVLVILAHPAIVGSVASASDESDWFDAGDRADIAEFGDDPSSKELDYASATLVGPFEFNSKTYYVAQYDGAAPSRFELDIERAKYSKDLLNDVNIGLIPRVKFFKKENGDLISISDPNRELVNTILRTNKARFHAQTKTSVNTPLNREVVDFQKNAISGLSSKITFPKQELSKLTKEKKDRYFAALKLMTERGTESIIPDEYEERIKKNVKDTSTLAGYADQTASLASELSKRQATLNDAAARRNMKLAAKALRKSSDVYENLAKRIKISEYSKSGDQVTAALSIFDLVIRLSESTVYADAKVKRLSRIQEYAASTEGVSLDSGLSDGIDRIKALKEDASAPEIAKDIEFWIKESVAGELGTYAAEKALKKFVTWKFSQTAASTALVAVAAADVGLTAGGLLTGKNKVWKRFTHAKYSRLAMMEFREVRKHIEKSKRESHLTGERAEAYYSAVYFEYESRAKFYEQMESGLQGTKVDDVLDFIQDRRGEEIAGKLAEDARNNTGLVGYVPTNETIGKTPTRPSIRFIDQTISSGSSAITIDTAEFSTQAASDGEFVVVIHKTTEETYGDGIGPKIGESDVLPPGTRQSVEVDLSRTLGPSDNLAELTESQSLVAMLHRADTDDGDNINHGSHITRNGDKVTSRAQVTVSSPPDRTLYTAGFESTPSGETPSDWTASGNSAIRVSNAQAADGTKSLRLSGSSGMCLETVGFGNLGQDSLFTQKTAGSASFSDRFDDGTLNSQWEGAGIDDPQVTESDGTLNHAVDFNYGSDNNRLQTTQTFDTTGTHRIEMRIRTTQSDYWGYGVALDGTNGKINLKEGKWEGFNRFVVSGVTDRPDKYSSDYNFYGEQTHKAKLADATSETSFITYSLTVNFDTQTVTEVRRGSKTWDTDLQIKDIGDSYQLRLPTGAGHDVEYDAIAVGPADGEWSLFNDAANEQMPTPTSTSSSSQSMNISFSVRPGGQAQTGCHDHNTGVNLNTGNDGTYGGEKIKLIEFTPDGSVEATFGENTPLGSYDVGTWTDVRVKYTPLKEGQARVAYFIDGEQRETITRGEPSFADQLSYLQVNTGEYTTYVDDIDITSAPSAETESPEANAGEDQTITAGKTVELDASGSAAPDNSVLSYQFQQVSQAGSAPDVSLQAPETQKTEFTAPDVDSETTVTFELTVTNSAGKTDTDRVNITITPPGVDTWTIPMEYPQFQMTTGDVDDDGSAELAVGNHGSYGPSEFGVVEQGRWVWNQSSDAPVHAETIGTVDTDMSPEFIFKSKVSSTWVRPYGIDTSSLWSVTHRGWPDTVRAADTDNDGKSEIAAMSHNNGYLTVIDNDGDVTWRTQSRANIERLFGLTEVTGDDTPEILTHSPPNDDKQGLQLITKTDTGGVEVVWRAEPNAPVRATLSELDSDTDASEEVIAAYPGRGLITSLDAETGETRWREQVASADRIRFADVTGDETPEVLLWSDTTLRVFSADSRSLIELSTSAPILRATGSGNGTLLLLTEDALISRTAEEELTRVQIDGTQVNEMSVGDTDGDNNPEVALGAGGSLRLYDNLEMASSQLEFPPDERPPASVTFTDQTISSGSSTLTVDTAQFGDQSIPGEEFVVVVHKATGETYGETIGSKVGESDVLSPGTRQSVEVDLSQTLGPSDDIAELTESQSLVVMLHRADTTDGDGVNHGAHITRDGAKVTSRAQVTVSSPPDDLVADAGPDQTVTAGKTVELDASGSTAPDNSALTYAFQQVSQTDDGSSSSPSVSLQAPETQTPEFTAPNVDSETTVPFELTVTKTDSTGTTTDTDTDRVNITITPADERVPPTSLTFTDKSIPSGSSTITIDTAQLGNQTVPGEEFVVVIHKTAEGTYADGIGPKIGESDILPAGTEQLVEVNISRTLGSSDDIDTVRKSQSFVAMLHRADTGDGDNTNHGSHITRDGAKVTSRAQITVNDEPKPRFDLNIQSINAPVAVGDRLTVTAQVTNTGDTPGQADLGVNSGGQLGSNQTTVDLSPGEQVTKTLALNTRSVQAGEYDLELKLLASSSSKTTTPTRTQTILIQRSPQPLITELNLNEEITQGTGDDAVVTVTNPNSDIPTDEFSLELSLRQGQAQPEVNRTRSLHLDANGSKSIVFGDVTSTLSAGTYDVNVSTASANNPSQRSQTLTVSSPSQASVNFENKSEISGTQQIIVDGVQLDDGVIQTNEFVIVVYKTSPNGEVGAKIGESRPISTGTSETNILVDFTQLGTDSQLSESQTLVARLHRNNTSGTGATNHGEVITQNGSVVSDRAQITIATDEIQPPDETTGTTNDGFGPLTAVLAVICLSLFARLRGRQRR